MYPPGWRNVACASSLIPYQRGWGGAVESPFGPKVLAESGICISSACAHSVSGCGFKRDGHDVGDADCDGCFGDCNGGSGGGCGG
jgi:hypothetical protein